MASGHGTGIRDPSFCLWRTVPVAVGCVLFDNTVTTFLSFQAEAVTLPWWTVSESPLLCIDKRICPFIIHRSHYCTGQLQTIHYCSTLLQRCTCTYTDTQYTHSTHTSLVLTISIAANRYECICCMAIICPIRGNFCWINNSPSPATFVVHNQCNKGHLIIHAVII